MGDNENTNEEQGTGGVPFGVDDIREYMNSTYKPSVGEKNPIPEGFNANNIDFEEKSNGMGHEITGRYSNGQVESEILYNDKDQAIGAVHYNTNGDPDMIANIGDSGVRVSSFDGYGQPSRTVSYGSVEDAREGKNPRKDMYFDENGERTHGLEYRKDGSLATESFYGNLSSADRSDFSGSNDFSGGKLNRQVDYREDGTKERDVQFYDNGKVSHDKKYRENGTLETEDIHSKDYWVNIHNEYDKNETLRSSRQTGHDGSIQCDQKFDKNGNCEKNTIYGDYGIKKSETTQKNGIYHEENYGKDGKTIERTMDRYKDGSSKEDKYSDGKISESTKTRANGNLEWEKTYEKGKLETETKYRENGSIKSTTHYNGGKAEKTYFDEKGKEIEGKKGINPFAKSKKPDTMARSASIKGADGIKKDIKLDSKVSDILKNSPAKKVAPIVQGGAGKAMSKIGPVK